MSVEKFVDDFECLGRISELIPEENSPVPLDEYQERQYVPMSIYDQHQELLFVEAVKRFSGPPEGAVLLGDWCRDRETNQCLPVPTINPFTSDRDLETYSFFDDLRKFARRQPPTDALLGYLQQTSDIEMYQKSRGTEPPASFQYPSLSEKLTDYVAVHKRQLSTIISEKVLFEMERDRAEIASWLVDEVTEYDDKLRIFDQALDSSNTAGLSVLMALGNLRGEAEAAGSLADLTKYLMVEIRHGMNSFSNSRALYTLLDDGTNQLSPLTKEKIKKELAAQLYSQAIKLADQGEEAFASELLAHEPVYAGLLESLVSTAHQLDDLTVQSTSLTKRQTKKANDAVTYYKSRALDNQFDDDVQMAAAKNCVKELSRYPAQRQLISKEEFQELYRILAENSRLKRNPNPGKNPSPTAIAEAGKGQAYMHHLTKLYPDLAAETVLRPEPTPHVSEREYATNINEGITDRNILSLFKMAAQLALQGETNISENEKHIASIYAELDVLAAELATDKRHLMKEAVDQSRHRRKFNAMLAGTLGKTHQIMFATQKLEVLHKIMALQKEHDTSQDSSYADQLNVLKVTAEQCIGNPIAQLSLDEATIRAICAEFDEEVTVE